MDTAPLIEGQKSVLTEKQKQRWKEDGYLVLKGVLSFRGSQEPDSCRRSDV